MSEPTAIVITGRAYQRRASLEVRGDTLMWRAQRGQVYPVAENIATTTHDVRDVMWIERRGSLAAAGLGAVGLVLIANAMLALGLVGIVLAVLLAGYRVARPLRWLGLDLGNRWLVLRVERECVPDARALVGRVEQQLLAGDQPRPPPLLP